MSVQVIDQMDDPRLWTALEGDGATPSTELDVVAGTDHFRLGADATSLRIEESANLGPVDVLSLQELRVAGVGDPHFPKRLVHDHADVLVVDLHALEPAIARVDAHVLADGHVVSPLAARPGRHVDLAVTTQGGAQCR